MDVNRILEDQSEDHWISISDLMTGLMVIFLFVALSYIQPITKIASAYEDTEERLFEALLDEFKEDLPRWNAEIDRDDLVVRFREPDVLFRKGSDELQQEFKVILDEFYPRYLGILTAPEFRDRIEEARIEGHTSSEWEPYEDREAYRLNMGLSQERTASVLAYVLAMPSVQDGGNWEWAKRHLVSLGYSSSRLKTNGSGAEDQEASRRVEFRVVTNAREQMEGILRASKL